VRTSLERNPLTVMTLFVNPMQVSSSPKRKRRCASASKPRSFLHVDLPRPKTHSIPVFTIEADLALVRPSRRLIILSPNSRTRSRPSPDHPFPFPLIISNAKTPNGNAGLRRLRKRIFPTFHLFGQHGKRSWCQ